MQALEIKQAGDTTDCRTEEGITVSLIDTISFLMGQLMERDLDNQNAQEALKDLRINGKWRMRSRKYSVMISIKKLPIQVSDTTNKD